MYILLSGGDIRGNYSSLSELKKGVNYWINLRPKDIMTYQFWEKNYPIEGNEWDWCYIPNGSRKSRLGKNGAPIPNSKYWGKNLVGIKWWKD